MRDQILRLLVEREQALSESDICRMILERGVALDIEEEITLRNKIDHLNQVVNDRNEMITQLT